jgi:hypothetical protein
MRQPLEKVEQLYEHGLIQPQRVSQRFPVSRPGGLPEHDFDRVARDKMNQQKHQTGDA